MPCFQVLKSGDASLVIEQINASDVFHQFRKPSGHLLTALETVLLTMPEHHLSRLAALKPDPHLPAALESALT